MKSITLKVNNPVGLHARPAARFVQLIKGFQSEVKVKNLTRNSEMINGKSLVKVLKIAVAQGQEIYVEAEGTDETEAVNGIAAFVESLKESE